MKKIAIQGIPGSFHDIAAHGYFKDEEIELICLNNFSDIFRAMHQDPTIYGMLAIENTIAGSLLQNNELIRNSNTRVIGEYKLRITHNLVCLPEEDWADITEVNSHPIALMQCRNFLEKHQEMKVVEAADTALSAKKIKDKNLRGHAAICSERAANLYGMKILERSIETNKRNFTRFLILADQHEANNRIEAMTAALHAPDSTSIADSNAPLADGNTLIAVPNKSNLVFSVQHHVGCLSQVLTILSFYQINLTKIQSLPIIGREWEYQFYVDVTFDDYLRFKQGIDAIMPLTRELKILGEYTQGEIDE